MNNLKQIWNTSINTKVMIKWIKRLLILVILVFVARACFNGCSRQFQNMKDSAVINTDSIPESYDQSVEVKKNPTFPASYPEGDLKCITEVGLEEISKYTNRESTEKPLVDAVNYYVQGVILKSFRNISINDEVMDTLDWKKYQENYNYKVSILEQIITTE